jgi:hypothetical protein
MARKASLSHRNAPPSQVFSLDLLPVWDVRHPADPALGLESLGANDSLRSGWSDCGM